jgi:RNA polymerase sigma-70 factor (ECF subfamily)
MLRAVAPHDVRAPDDAPLIERIGRGDLGALGELYDRHNHCVRAFLARATSNAADVDDLVQETFLGAARIAARYDGRASSRPWLIGIAANLVQRRGRTLGQIARLFIRVAGEHPSARDARPHLEARDDLRRVGAALERMDVAKRVVVLMVQVEGLTCDEVAGTLGIPVGTVWRRLHAARNELRMALREEVSP